MRDKELVVVVLGMLLAVGVGIFAMTRYPELREARLSDVMAVEKRLKRVETKVDKILENQERQAQILADRACGH